MSIAELASKGEKRKKKVTQAVKDQAAAIEARSGKGTKETSKFPEDTDKSDRKLGAHELFAKDADPKKTYALVFNVGFGGHKEMVAHNATVDKDRTVSWGYRTTKVRFWSPKVEEWLSITGNYVVLSDDPAIIKEMKPPQAKRAVSETTKEALKKGAARFLATKGAVNATTGFREETFAHLAATQYLTAKTQAEAIAKIIAAATAYYEAKKDADPVKHATREAKIWTKILPTKDAGRYKVLPEGAVAKATEKSAKDKEQAKERKAVAKLAKKSEKKSKKGGKR